MFQRLLENKLFVKAEKCEFLVRSVAFLGYIIGSGQVRTDPEKIQAVAEWRKPTFVKFSSPNHRLIRDYNRVAAILTQFTSSAIRFSWTPKADTAFSELKNRFTSTPVLVQADPSQKVIVEVASPDSGVGALTTPSL